MLLQVSGFAVLTFDGFFCAQESLTCFLIIDPTFAVTVLLVPITILRVVDLSHGVVEVGVTLVLDLVGVVCIPLLWCMVVEMVTGYARFDEDITPRFLTIFWGCELGAKLATQLMPRLCHVRRLPSSTPSIFPHLNPIDLVGGSAGASVAAWGATRTFAATIPLWQYILFAVVATLMSRYGRMFVGMLKQLSGVHCTGRLIPGIGMLDSLDRLLFMAATFAIFNRVVAPEVYAYDAKHSLVSQVEMLVKLTLDQQWVLQTLKQIIQLIHIRS
ncbi:hypothetical protein AaE_000773 [Aphanomyces astaci]|uniref:Uncharacterized protein n=1 Tax=Aphanomyces astaci TaxID=112090 RepID=A0A6A5ATG6_APHAT|nr:hypothetical protein AaE_000773 [Aphanomyces astaci]